MGYVHVEIRQGELTSTMKETEYSLNIQSIPTDYTKQLSLIKMPTDHNLRSEATETLERKNEETLKA